MNTSRTTFLSKPAAGEKIAPETFGYMRARAKRRAYDLVIKEFKKSGLTKAELARRLGKGPDRVSKMLGGPGNWTIATVADLLFAIAAAEPTWGLGFPLDKAKRNDTLPRWLTEENPLVKAASNSPQANTSPPMALGLSTAAKSLPMNTRDFEVLLGRR